MSIRGNSSLNIKFVGNVECASEASGAEQAKGYGRAGHITEQTLTMQVMNYACKLEKNVTPLHTGCVASIPFQCPVHRGYLPYRPKAVGEGHRV